LNIIRSLISSVVRQHTCESQLFLECARGLVLAGLHLACGYLRRLAALPIGLHIGWNFFEGTVFGFQVSGLSGMPTLIRQIIDGPELLTGGAFGPEAGLVILPAFVLGVLLVYGYTRQRLIASPPKNSGSQ
jgi:hypothetical protein